MYFVTTTDELTKIIICDHDLRCWAIWHGQENYKTGKTYRQQPPLPLQPDQTGTFFYYLAMTSD